MRTNITISSGIELKNTSLGVKPLIRLFLIKPRASGESSSA